MTKRTLWKVERKRCPPGGERSRGVQGTKYWRLQSRRGTVNKRRILTPERLPTLTPTRNEHSVDGSTNSLRNRWTRCSSADCESLTRANRPERAGDGRIRSARVISMLMTKERPRAIRTLRGWAINVLQEADAIHECAEHGWAHVWTYMDPARLQRPA